MDIEHFISNSSQFSFQYDEFEPHELPCELYDQQSQEEQPEPTGSVDEVLQMMMSKQALIDQPMADIIQDAMQNYHLPEHKATQLARKAKKTKNILKRIRAKGRLHDADKHHLPLIEKKEAIWDESSTEKDTIMMEKEIKKQRNRISAQISRDRKKNYVTSLEQINKQLAFQSESLKLENQRLKKQIRERNGEVKVEPKPKVNNKFIRLLILLGFVFLMYILKDVFHIKTNKNSTIMKLQEQVQEEEIANSVSMNEQGDIVEEIRAQINEIEEEEAKQGAQGLLAGSNSGGLKDTILKKVGELKRKTKELILPSRLAMHMLEAKNLLLF